MPGSKRRALKKLLSPDSSSPSESIDTTISPTPDSSSAPLSHSISSSSNMQSSTASAASASGTSIATDPANYLTDQALEEDLAIEAAADRGEPIPDNFETDGPASVPAPAPATQEKKSHSPPVIGGMYAAFGGFGNGLAGRGGKKSSKQRFAERQARKKDILMASAPPNDPAWNDQLEKERQDEIAIISNACDVLGRDIYEIAPDGHCMYSAIADQLGQLGLIGPAQAVSPQAMRRVCAQFMRDHPDDFIPFLASVDGEDMPGATDDGLMTEAQFHEYTRRVEGTGEWGGEPEIQALTRAYKVPIHVIQRGPPTVVSHGGDSDAFGGGLTPEQSLACGPKVVRISYHRRMYGLGEHYNSLRLL